jgi:hypothetical protein
MAGYPPHHGTYLAHRITLEGRGEDAFAKSLSTARVETKPHQVDAALFALHSPLSKGVILVDEVGLGKTIEASLVIAQSWAERRRRILLVVPASLVRPEHGPVRPLLTSKSQNGAGIGLRTGLQRQNRTRIGRSWLGSSDIHASGAW